MHSRVRSSLTRRDFLRTTSAASVATLAAPAVLRGLGPESKKLRIAVIGCGGRGGGNLQSVESEEIVALCDVNQSTLRAAGERHPQARRFADFRKLFEHEEEFDAVVVSTAEHTHAFATLPALQLGKHVYCEKPLTYNIAEARVIREAAAKAKVATQMGIQIHAENDYRRVVELIQAGAIGKVREVHNWVSRAWGWHESEELSRQHGDIVHVQDRPKSVDPVPKDLDWDLWLGPAPERPFNNVYVPGPKWYRWWDFANGTMSDLGSHRMDLPVWALKLKGAEDDRGARPSAARGTRAGVDAGRLRIRRGGRSSGSEGLVVPRNREAGAVEGEADSAVGRRHLVRRRQWNALG